MCAKDDEEHVTVIYWHVVGSNTNFYSKTGTVTSPSANIDWDSPVLIDDTTVNSSCISASGSCVGVAVAAAPNGNVFAAFKWVASGATYFSYEIMESTDGGDSWDDSLPEVTGVSIYRPALTITSLDSDKMLFAYLKYDSADLYYRLFNGTSWSTVQTITGTGMATNTYKQVSSTFVGIGDSAAYIAYTNVTASTAGILKVARFFGNGTYAAIETADNTLRHNLPSILSSPEGILNILSISNGKVYDTRQSAGVWETPFNPFGTNFTSLDQLTGAIVMDGTLTGLWRESTGSPYNVRFGLLEKGIVQESVTDPNSPYYTDYYEGERRTFLSTGSVLFAFYYNGSQILYKTSVDGGHSWSLDSVSTGTGQLAHVRDYRWTILHSFYNSTERVSVLYYRDFNGQTGFYAKTFVVNGRELSLNSTVLLDAVNSNAPCFVEGQICNAVITGATNANGTTMFAAYSWEDLINNSWSIAIKKSSNGGQSWLSSGGYTTTGYKTDPTPITMTQLDSGKMLMAFTTYQQSYMDYSIYNGSFWSTSPATITNIGWSNNTVKQISSDTVADFSSNSTTPTVAYVAYLSSGNSGSLKVAAFYGNGTFKGIETADSTLSHKLPSLTANNGFLRAYTISGNTIYLTSRNATGWLPPTTPYGASLGSPDQLTSQLGGAFQIGVMWANGTSGNYTLRYDGTFDVFEGVVRGAPYLAFYDDEPHGAIYAAKITCNFSGTNRTLIQSDNYLTCGESLQNPTHTNDEDWGYTAYATLTQTGNITVGGDVWKACEKFWPKPIAQPCDGTDPGVFEHKFTFSTPTNAQVGDDITLFMEWNVTGTTIGNTTNWYYQINNEPTKHPVASLVRVSQQISDFNKGTYYSLTSGLVRALYFQAGIGSAYNIGHGGWSVLIKNPAYVDQKGGLYNTFFTPARSVQGDASFWDGTFKWGGEPYTGVSIESFCHGGTGPEGEVTFEYTGSDTVTGTRLWGGC